MNEIDGVMRSVMIAATDAMIMIDMNGIRTIDANIPIGHTIPKWWMINGVEVNHATTPHEIDFLINMELNVLRMVLSPSMSGMKDTMRGLRIINDETTMKVS